jgi:hypothetical protein
MARDLASVIRFHQTLHGYADGHRLLASSLPIKGKDANTMLVMSDASITGSAFPDGGYLTGYPLPDSRLYALSRTWSAPEMPRPGCVWTHTILIEFSELASIQNPDILIPEFRRPLTIKDTRYNSQIEVPASKSDFATGDFGPTKHATVSRWLSALYDFPREKIVATSEDAEVSELVLLAIWAQQWPRLRRSFRFCTLTQTDRSADGAPFDIQLVAYGDRSSRSRFVDFVDADKQSLSPESYLTSAIADLMPSSDRTFREFLRMVGGDVSSGREAFVPLCRLYSAINRANDHPSAIGDAIGVLNTSVGFDGARSARQQVLRIALENIEKLDADAMNFVVANLSSFEFGDADASKFGKALWATDKAAFSELFVGSTSEKLIADATLHSLSTTELLKGFSEMPSMQRDILNARPDLVATPRFWNQPIVSLDRALSIAEKDERALDAIVKSRNLGVIQQSFKVFGAEPTVKAMLAELNSSGGDHLRPSEERAWLSVMVSFPSPLASALASSAILDFAFLSKLARASTPDQLPNIGGRDPWYVATTSSSFDGEKRDKAYLSAFLIARAIGESSSDPAELLVFAFDTVDTALQAYSLPEDAWRLIDRRLPWTGIGWFEEKRRTRLHRAVASYFVDHQLPASLFVRLTNDEDTLARLLYEVSSTSAGRRYIEAAALKQRRDE